MKRGVILALNLLIVIFHFSCNEDSGTGTPLVPPTIASITPNQASRAERVVGTIAGTNLNGATQVYLGDGVTVEGFSVLNANTIEVRFTVNTNAAAGNRPVEVVTPAGTARQSDIFSVLDNRAPLPRISVEPSANGATNTVYTFDGFKSDDPDGNIVRFEFEFGDGKKANGPVVSHKFASVGRYEVIMRVTDDQDAQNFTSVEINVKEGTAPTAKFTVFPKDGDITTTYTFDASNSVDPDGTIQQFQWDFGNGNTANGPTAQFNFRNSGVFSVTLVVKDDDGLQNSARKDVTVGSFNAERAAQEIRDIIVGFFRRYSDLQGLTAEQIVVDWSTSSQCRGRAHEINIINKQKQTIQQTKATPGNIDVTFGSFTRAHAIAPADFAWTEFSGASFTGFAVHDFEMIFESGEWWICNFVLL